MRGTFLTAFVGLFVVSAPQIASSADLAYRAVTKAPAQLPLSYNWTGFYAGLNVGYGWGQNSNTATTFFEDPVLRVGLPQLQALGGLNFPSVSPNGFIGGGQIGYDHQWDSLVGGIVADLQATDIGGSGMIQTAIPGRLPTQSITSISQRLNLFGTVRAKVGLAANNWLFYGTGGLAYGDVRSSVGLNLVNPAFPVVMAGDANTWLAGWTAGAGVNYGFGNWIFGVEYLHYDLGSASATATVRSININQGTTSSITASQIVSGDLVRGTISFRLHP